MSTETLSPNSIVSTSGFTGATVAALAADDGSWATNGGSGAKIRIGFPSPTKELKTGAGLQTFTVKFRQSSSSPSTGNLKLDLVETGSSTVLATANRNTSAGLTTTTLSMTWDAALLSDISGADVEAVLTSNGTFGSLIDVGFASWVDQYVDTVAVATGLALQSNTAFSTGVALALQPSNELDNARMPLRLLIAAAGMAGDGSAAFQLYNFTVGLLTEADLSFSLGSGQTISPAISTNLAFALSTLLPNQVGLAQNTGAAFRLGMGVAFQLGLDIESAITLGAALPFPIQLAADAELALALQEQLIALAGNTAAVNLSWLSTAKPPVCREPAKISRQLDDPRPAVYDTSRYV